MVTHGQDDGLCQGARLEPQAAQGYGPPRRVGAAVVLAASSFAVEWGIVGDLERARKICQRHALGLVDGIVIAVAERLGADAIATLDLRHFGAVAIRGQPKLYPRDL